MKKRRLVSLLIVPLIAGWSVGAKSAKDLIEWLPVPLPVALLIVFMFALVVSGLFLWGLS
jgi:hypothetical protein